MGKIIFNDINYGGLSGPSTGDRVYLEQVLTQGTHIADLIVNDITTPIYAPPGAVNDVMVQTPSSGGYVSVVTQGIGKINLNDLYLNKQNVLTPGANISISNNVISASKTNVSVDPHFAGGVNLCTITIDGTDTDIYIPSSAIAGVSGVTLNGVSVVDQITNIAEITVEPNPNETATGSLTKLKIGSTVYGVAATDEKVSQQLLPQESGVYTPPYVHPFLLGHMNAWTSSGAEETEIAYRTPVGNFGYDAQFDRIIKDQLSIYGNSVEIKDSYGYGSSMKDDQINISGAVSGDVYSSTGVLLHKSGNIYVNYQTQPKEIGDDASKQETYIGYDSIKIGDYTYDDVNPDVVIKECMIENDDITLSGTNNTWDGSHTSLKDAIANAGGGGGSSDLEAIEITQAAYDELEPTQKLDENKIYFIKDASGGGGGSGTTVIANPTGTPTDELKKLQVENIIYQVDKSEENRIYLFKNGQWQNTDILQFASHGCTIANNKLTFLGDSVGVCVSDVSGLAGQGINSYRVVFKIIDIPSGGIGIQAGRCNPTTDEYNIINTGTNRISYTNDTYSEGITYLATVSATSNAEGVFFGAGYATPSTNYAIEEIYMDINQTVEKSYN